jgi:hypothetical protein
MGQSRWVKTGVAVGLYRKSGEEVRLDATLSALARFQTEYKFSANSSPVIVFEQS